MVNLDYRCPKCNETRHEIAEMRATGGFFSKLFNIQTQRYTTVTCERCRYTEFFAADSSKLGNIFDFFTN